MKFTKKENCGSICQSCKSEGVPVTEELLSAVTTGHEPGHLCEFCYFTSGNIYATLTKQGATQLLNVLVDKLQRANQPYS